MKIKNTNFGFKWASFFTALVLGIVLFSCDSEKEGDDDGFQLKENYEINEGLYTFFANPEKYKDTDLKRGQDNLCQVETKISRVKREGNVLSIEILKPKDCEIEYEIIWDGVVLFSDPMQSAIYVRSLANNCNGEPDTETDILVVNLEETFKPLKKEIIDNAIIMVKDACSLVNIDCVGDCNVISSY